MSILITITSNEHWNTKTHKKDLNPPITKHILFPKRSVKMIDGSETRKRLLASSRVFEKGSNLVNFSIEKS